MTEAHPLRCGHIAVCKMQQGYPCSNKDPLFHCSEDTRENIKLQEDTEVELSCGSIETTRSSAKSEAVLEELRKHFVKLYDDGFKDPLVTFDAAISMMKYGDTKLRQQER